MQDEPTQFYFPPRRNEVITVLFTGLLASAAAVSLAWLVSTYLISPVFCAQSSEGFCSAPLTFSYNIFLILSALVATGWFAYSRIYRPALVTLPAVIMFWSLPAVFAPLLTQGILIFGLISVLLISFSYLVFYWVVRVRNFLAVFLIWLALALLMRFMLVL